MAQLDTFGLLEVLYKSFNRESSVRVRLEDIVKQQKYQIFTSAIQSDKYFKKVQQMIRIETESINRARDVLTKAQEKQNARLLAEGKDYYQDMYDDNDFTNESTNTSSSNTSSSNNKDDDILSGFSLDDLDD